MTANVYRCTLVPVEKETMTANSKLETAIAAGINSLEALIRECVSYRDVQGFSAHEEVYQLINGYRIDPKRPDASKAFAAYREQVAALVAENARLKAFVQSLADFEYDWDFPSAGYREFIHQAGELLADVEATSTADDR